jgi:hypothetical protein
VLLAAYRQFEERFGVLTSARGAKTEMILAAIRNLPDGFRVADIERICPNVTRDMIRVVLNRLEKRRQRPVRRRGSGRHLPETW